MKPTCTENTSHTTLAIAASNTITSIAATLARRITTTKRFLRPVAEQYAGALVRFLQQDCHLDQVTVAGSYRRLRETVGDLDILVTVANGEARTA